MMKISELESKLRNELNKLTHNNSCQYKLLRDPQQTQGDTQMENLAVDQ
jgi:hypothetical protein